MSCRFRAQRTELVGKRARPCAGGGFPPWAPPAVGLYRKGLENMNAVQNLFQFEGREPVEPVGGTDAAAFLEAMRNDEVLTPFVAVTKYRSCALSQRIGDLRRAGHSICRGWLQSESGTRVRAYWICRHEFGCEHCWMGTQMNCDRANRFSREAEDTKREKGEKDNGS